VYIVVLYKAESFEGTTTGWKGRTKWTAYEQHSRRCQNFGRGISMPWWGSCRYV